MGEALSYDFNWKVLNPKGVGIDLPFRVFKRLKKLYLLERVMPEDFTGTGATLLGRGSCLVKPERYEESEATVLEAHDILAASMGEENERTIAAVQSLVDLYQSWGKP